MVFRVYVEKRPGFRQEAASLLREIHQYLNIRGLTGLRIINRYDAEGVSGEVFQRAVEAVFSEPQLDEYDHTLTLSRDARSFAVEALPGQFDQRADSAQQCIQLMTAGERPTVRCAKVYVLQGELTGADVDNIKKYVINPVESREASSALPQSLQMQLEAPGDIPVLEGFRSMDAGQLEALLHGMELAMDMDDLLFVQQHFLKEERDPTETELRVMDTYWSDHCRHTTFLTQLRDVRIEDAAVKASYDKFLALKEKLGRNNPPTLMEAGTIAAKALKKEGLLPHLDESEEINACTVRIKADTPQGEEDWLLLFKNETHNHPTEIEPFGGAATCIGGAIRDPLSARSYVYAGMRVTGAADPNQPMEETLQGKLPQRKICTGAAAGFSSYGNQIGLTTGLVKEFYHPGFAAKRLEAGAVLGAAPLRHVRRERPAPGDIVILLGGRTGRDGIGGATGSSKAHTVESVDTCASQVQKGNAPEERKLQRLFLNPQVTHFIKRCNDFGAGGVSVAVGELADGLDIDLDKVPRKYEGLNGTELAISESQERMAVVVEAKDVQDFCALAAKENLEATPIAVVTEEKRMVMRWRGKPIVDLDREFLSSNGAKKTMDVRVTPGQDWQYHARDSFSNEMKKFISSLDGCSQRGLGERFDATIGGGTVLMPFGGKHQDTPPCAMVHTLPVPGGTTTASYMAYGYNPHISQKSPYHGAYLAVVESVTNRVAAGADFEHVYLSFQEYFPRPGKDAARWGLPLASLMGALRAQMELGVAAIGGKDSMSGTFGELDVPPTLISFAVTWDHRDKAAAPAFQFNVGSGAVWLRPQVGEDGLPTADSLKAVYARVAQLKQEGRLLNMCAVTEGGAAAAVEKMCRAGDSGFVFEDRWTKEELFQYAYGSIIAEVAWTTGLEDILLGTTQQRMVLEHLGDSVSLQTLGSLSEKTLEGVYPVHALTPETPVNNYRFEGKRTKGMPHPRPRVLIPAFPGTNCELDTARAFEEAGAQADILVIRNLTPGDVAASVEEMAARLKKAQMVLIPGGFSGGDEPEGSAKLITAFFRSPRVREALEELLDVRKGLVGGICNGFQALVKLGLVPYGRIMDTDVDSPTLTHNLIGRHQSRMVRVKTFSNLSPWFLEQEVGEILPIALSHGEGRFVCAPSLLDKLANNGQIAAQYVDDAGEATMDIRFNPPGSAGAVEALTSPDGRVLGRMGHSERIRKGLYKNLPVYKEDPLFRSAVRYFE